MAPPSEARELKSLEEAKNQAEQYKKQAEQYKNKARRIQCSCSHLMTPKM